MKCVNITSQELILKNILQQSSGFTQVHVKTDRYRSKSKFTCTFQYGHTEPNFIIICLSVSVMRYRLIGLETPSHNMLSIMNFVLQTTYKERRISCTTIKASHDGCVAGSCFVTLAFNSEISTKSHFLPIKYRVFLCESYNCLAAQEIPRLLWDTKNHQRVHTSALPTNCRLPQRYIHPYSRLSTISTRSSSS